VDTEEQYVKGVWEMFDIFYVTLNFYYSDFKNTLTARDLWGVALGKRNVMSNPATRRILE